MKKAIVIHIDHGKSDDPLFGQSKWWGFADMPDDMDYPVIPYEDGDDDPLTLVCQIRCSDLAEVDPEGLLPHEGMLYFFADIDKYVGDLRGEEDEEDEDYPFHNNMGEWSPEVFRVLYSPTEKDLHSHRILNDDGSSYALPAEKITFTTREDRFDDIDFHLLGHPCSDELEYWYPGYINLFQICEEWDHWGGLFLYDTGFINFLIKPEDLKARRFDHIIAYLLSL